MPAPDAALARALAAWPRPPRTLAVALSAGPDSTALILAAASHAAAHGLSLHAFHVHHGLHPRADAWADAARAIGARLGCPVHVAHVAVDAASGLGIEAAARAARYAALVTLARRHAADVVLLAQHQDDQAETVLHRLLRGAGVDGAGGMPESFTREGVAFLRPWLGVPRAVLLPPAQAWAAEHGIALADDPSNLDARHARGALRRDVMPAVAAHWPAYRDALGRFARQAREAAAVLHEVASEDLARVTLGDPTPGAAIDLARWRALGPARRALVLRAWLARAGLTMPGEARLIALTTQLDAAAPDRQLLWRHAGHAVRRHRERLVLDAEAPQIARGEVPLDWQGEPALPVPAWDGVLHFDRAEVGIDPAWLRAGPLRLAGRRGGERLRVSPGGPHRSLKNLHQEHGIPAWQRDGLPLLWRGTQLVFAAALGPDADAPHGRPGIALRWQPGTPRNIAPR